MSQTQYAVYGAAHSQQSLSTARKFLVLVVTTAALMGRVVSVDMLTIPIKPGGASSLVFLRDRSKCQLLRTLIESALPQNRRLLYYN